MTASVCTILLVAGKLTEPWAAKRVCGGGCRCVPIGQSRYDLVAFLQPGKHFGENAIGDADFQLYRFQHGVWAFAGKDINCPGLLRAVSPASAESAEASAGKAAAGKSIAAKAP